MIYLTLRLHAHYKLKYYYYVFIGNITWFYVIIFIYFFLQFNFELISHNFGIKINQFINTTDNFLFALIFVLIGIMLTNMKQLTYCNIFIELTRQVKLKLLNKALVLVLLISGVVISSFTMLINDFC
jgi:hypothetical protein